MGIREMKHAALLQEWSGRITECRGSGLNVKSWCEAHGVAVKRYYYWEKRIVDEAARQSGLPAAEGGGMLVRVNPATLQNGKPESMSPCITIHHGESVITLPAASSAEAVANLVKALNRHA